MGNPLKVMFFLDQLRLSACTKSTGKSHYGCSKTTAMGVNYQLSVQNVDYTPILFISLDQ